MIRSFLLHRTCAHRGMIVCDHKSCDRLSEWTGIWPGAGPHMCSGFHQKDITSPPSLPPRLQHSPVIGLSVCTLVGQLPRHTLYIYSCSFQTPGYGRSFWKLVKELIEASGCGAAILYLVCEFTLLPLDSPQKWYTTELTGYGVGSLPLR